MTAVAAIGIKIVKSCCRKFGFPLILPLIFLLVFVQVNIAQALVTAPSCTGSINRYDVCENTYTYTNPSTNPWENSSGSYITAVFTTPSGKQLPINGFYYDVNTYKLRFTPAEVGSYSYQVTLSGGPDGTKTYPGTFTSVASARKGFVRRNPNNRYRFQFENGTFFSGTGFNDCWYAPSPLYSWTDLAVKAYVDPYMQTYSNAEFNLFRWNPANCGFGLGQIISTSGNAYDVTDGKMGDELLTAAKKYDFHTLFTFFTCCNIPYTDVSNTQQMQAIQRYMNYVLARYGAYIDMWELTNETGMSSAWLQYFANYMQSVDPYQRLLTNSNPQNQDWAFLDFRGPHGNLFDGYSELQNYTNNFSTGEGVMVGEGYQDTGHLCNWNSLTAQNLRTATWTSLMSGLGLVWWATNGTKSYCPTNSPPNIYIGTEERGYVKIAQNLLGTMDKDSQFRILPSSNHSGNDAVTVYNLSSPSIVLVYFFKGLGFTTPVTTTTSINLPSNGMAYWIDPKTGLTLQTFAVAAGTASFTTPSISQDVVLQIVFSANPAPTFTPSPNPTPTPTFTLTPNPTSTPTSTPTATPTFTPTPKNTPTATPTSTLTPTNTPTNMPTATPTSTLTPKNTPTNTPTATPTSTLTPKNTPTNMPPATPTFTLTPKNTPTSAPTGIQIYLPFIAR